MPLYTYKCTWPDCGKEFDANARLEHRDDPVFCKCGGMAKRLYSHNFAIKNHPTYTEAVDIVQKKYDKGEIA